jgi:ABC-type oligopeptide transport system ATPase subunit
MHEGKIIEKNNSKDLFSYPKEEYTKKLIKSVPSPIPIEKKHGS